MNGVLMNKNNGLKNIPKVPVPKFNKQVSAPADSAPPAAQQGQIQLNLDELRKEKMNCECGSIIRIADKTKHYKTRNHIDFINSNNIIEDV